MKKYLGLLLTGIFIFILSACGLSGIDKSVSENANSIVQEIDTSMPAPFGEEDQGDADKNFAYYSPCRHKFDEVTSNLTKLVDQNEFNKWCDAKKISDKAPTKLTDYLNLYSFIVDFNISNDVLKKVLVDERDFFKSLNWYDDSYDYHYTDDEIEILCSRDESKIMEHFASKYSIVNNGRIYSPHWVYTHTIQAYETEKIPPELIKEKMEVYKEIPFVSNAREAFEKKLNEYVKT